MHAQELVAALQRIAAKTVQIKPAASGNQDPLVRLAGVVQALEPVAPVPVLVDFIERPEIRIRQIALENTTAAFVHAPVQISIPGARQAFRQGGLADLARASARRCSQLRIIYYHMGYHRV